MENGNVNQLNSNIDKDYFLFANFILGMKGIPYNTEALLINNIPDKTLDILYSVDDSKKIIKIAKEDIKNVSYTPEINMQKGVSEIKSNENKSALLSAAVFGGNPLMQLAGGEIFNSIIDDATGNYNKMKLDGYYRLNIDFSSNNQDIKFLLNVNSNPEIFIQKMK